MNSKNWTTDKIPDQTGKIAIVTGANSGLGYETAKALLEKNATVILASRSQAKGETALNQIKGDVPSADGVVMPLDLGDLQSVQAFAEAFLAKYDRLDLLINNAGIMMTPYGLTKDGFEQQFGVNHLGHFALTGLLFDRLTGTQDARVVNVSSTGHRAGSMDFDDLMFEGGKGYSPMSAYGRSKLANLLFSKGLQARFEKLGSGTLAVTAHPGGSNTNLSRHVEERFIFRILGPVLMPMMSTAAQGALPQLRAAVDPNVKGDEYYGPNGFGELRGFPVLVNSSTANNAADAEKLWKVSEALTGVKYG